MIKTFKYRIKDNSAKKMLRRHAYGVNQIWNYLNARQKDIEKRYHSGAPKRKWGSHFDLQKLVKGCGAEFNIHQQTVGGVCKQFAVSRDKAHHSLRFRSSFGAKKALGWIPFDGQSRQITEGTVTYLGKTYHFFGSKKRPLPENAKGGAFVEDALGRWYVCFHVEVEDVKCLGNEEIGIDLGLKTLASLSNGEKIEPKKFTRQYEEKLAVAQRARNKQKVRRIHAKIKNCRKDFLHRETTRLSRNYALIAVGDVNSKNLAKTRMAKSVLDASWSTFRTMLKYKSSGFVEVDEKFTTQTCSECGTLPASRPKGIAGLGVRNWECSSCGASHDRDVNAARNILNFALIAQRPVVESRRRA